MCKYKNNRSSKREDVVKCFQKSYELIRHYRLDSEQSIKQAFDEQVWSWVYRDFSYRTLTVKQNGMTIKDFTSIAKDFLAKNYYLYFSQDTLAYYKYNDLNNAILCENFESWHENMCESLLELIRKRYIDKLENGQGYTDVEYGKAQKIINMVFKYIYCFDDSAKYASKFEPCHMTIDAIIIDWTADIVFPALGDDSPRRSNSVKWSKSFRKGSVEEEYTYLWYQEKIKEFLKNNYLDQNGMPFWPIVAEFYAWPEEQWIRTTKEWLTLDVNQDYFPKYKNKYVDQMNREIRKHI